MVIYLIVTIVETKQLLFISPDPTFLVDILSPLTIPQTLEVQFLSFDLLGGVVNVTMGKYCLIVSFLVQRLFFIHDLSSRSCDHIPQDYGIV